MIANLPKHNNFWNKKKIPVDHSFAFNNTFLKLQKVFSGNKDGQNAFLLETLFIIIILCTRTNLSLVQDCGVVRRDMVCTNKAKPEKKIGSINTSISENLVLKQFGSDERDHLNFPFKKLCI